MVRELKKQGVLLHGAYCYCPFPLQDPNIRRYRDSRAPNNMEKWKEICAAVADHYLNMGIPFGVDEVWTEDAIDDNQWPRIELVFSKGRFRQGLHVTISRFRTAASVF